MEFRRAVVPQPYNPDPNASSGDRQCLLRYHEYWATPGCGGFELGVRLHKVRSRPGYLAGLSSTGGHFTAYADTARTFGCLRPDGSFDHDTSFVVRTEQQPLSPVYYEPDSNWLLRQFRTYPDRDLGPPFFVNFPAVEVSCPEGTTATQYGLKVTNVKVTIDAERLRFDGLEHSRPVLRLTLEHPPSSSRSAGRWPDRGAVQAS